MKRRLCDALVVCASLIAGGLIFTYTILPGGPFGWDEASHAIWGLLITDDLQRRDWLGVIYDSYRQVYWPPLHSWLTGIGFLIAGPTAIAARGVSVVAFVLLSLVVYATAKLMRQQEGELAGITAAILLLSSPPLVRFAARSMLEIPALLALSLTLLIYVKATGGESSPRQPLLLGLGMSMTYFAKPNYGILLLVTLVITLCIDARFRPRLLLTRFNLYTAVPMVIIFAIWFAYPAKATATWRLLIHHPTGVAQPYSIEGFLYYPRAMYDASGSVWLFALLLVSLLAAFRFRRNKTVRFLIVLVLIQILIAQLHQAKRGRHILPVMPALFLLAGYVTAECWRRCRQPGTVLRPWQLRLFIGALCLHAIHLFSDSLRPPPGNHRDEVSGFVATAVRDTGPTFILGTRDLGRPHPPVLDWYLIAHEHLMAVPRAGSITQAGWERRIAAALTHYRAPVWLADAMRPVLARTTQPGTTRSFYLGLPNTPDFRDQAELETFLQNTLVRDLYEGAVIISSLAPSARYPLHRIAPALHGVGLSRILTRDFTDAAVRVDVYKRQRSSDDSSDRNHGGDRPKTTARVVVQVAGIVPKVAFTRQSSSTLLSSTDLSA